MILRLTLHTTQKPDDGDLAVDADMVYAVNEDMTSDGVKLAYVYTRAGTYFIVRDPNRDVISRWIAASGGMEESCD